MRISPCDAAAPIPVRRLRARTVPATALVVLLAGTVSGVRWWERRVGDSLPNVTKIDLQAAFFDLTPVTITFNVGGLPVDVPTTADAVERNVLLWQRMRLPHWNGVPAHIRRLAFNRMLGRYEPL